MKLNFEIVKDIKIPPLPNLKEINFSHNLCTATNIFSFVNAFLQSSTNLEILNISNMDMNGESICDFSLIPSSLLELDMSKNNRMSSLNVLDIFFVNCNQLKKLNVSEIGLKSSNFDYYTFYHITGNLEEFNLSGNNELDDTLIINQVITRC